MKYRAEIDGLRAIAVVPVILFHAGFSLFSGGFVGVDVFFVISGYLITSLIFNDMEHSRFSLLQFYERRARRILPALFFVMLVCIPFAWYWFMPVDLNDFAQSLIAVSTFSSNILFWLQSGYFDSAAEFKPLLHTWSLAVEEQYYILFPLFLMVCWRFGKRVNFVLLSLIMLGSFLAACFAPYIMQHPKIITGNFYLLPTRGWELLIGVLAAFVLQKDTLNLPNNAKNILSSFGLLLIIFSIFLFDKTTPFPSAYTLMPTVGTVLIIVFANSGCWVHRLLSLKAFVGIGLISYSAYLWHQPILAFVKYRFMGQADDLVLLVLCLSVFPLAYFTWRFIEQPFRNKQKVSRVFIFSASTVGALAFMSLGFQGFITKGFENYYFEHRANAQQVHYLSYQNFAKTKAFVDGYRLGTCFFNSDLSSTLDKESCLTMSKDKPNYLLVGDSHAAHLAQAFANKGINLLQATANGCRPLKPYEGEEICRDLIKDIFENFIPNHKIDGLILSGRWHETDLIRFGETFNWLLRQDIDILIIGPTVEYYRNLPEVLARKEVKTDRIAISDGVIKTKRFKVDRQLKSIIERYQGKVNYLSLIDLLCDNKSCQTTTNDDIPLVWDYGHYTLEGAEYVVERSKVFSLLNVHAAK